MLSYICDFIKFLYIYIESLSIGIAIPLASLLFYRNIIYVYIHIYIHICLTLKQCKRVLLEFFTMPQVRLERKSRKDWHLHPFYIVNDARSFFIRWECCYSCFSCFQSFLHCTPIRKNSSLCLQQSAQ